MKAKIQNGVYTLNQIVELVALPWMKWNKHSITVELALIFCDLNIDKVMHLIDKFTANKDFASFYLNIDSEVTKAIFDNYFIPLEEDKYSSTVERFKALTSDKKSRWEVFPFESEIVRQFYLMAYNNSLQLLKDISEDAYNHVKKRKINLYGNGKNWSKAWSILTDQEKEAVVNYLLSNKF